MPPYDLLLGCLAIVALSLALEGVRYRYERRLWNRGRCRKNGVPWKFSRTNRLGERVYRAGEYQIRLKWPVDGGRINWRRLWPL